MADQPETIAPKPAPRPAFAPTRGDRIVKILKNVIGNQAVQIAELAAVLEERTADLVQVRAELEKLKPAPPAKE